MTLVEWRDLYSMTRNYGHNRLGADDVIHKSKIIKSISTNVVANDTVENLDTVFEYEVAFVPAGYEHRPDLISDLFYDTPGNDWLILLANNIDDPFEGLNVNDRIILPKV